MKKLNNSLYAILVLFFVFSFRVAYADVVINEVAWMGTSDSASNEWLELYNNGTSSVNLSGWFVKTSDGNISIALTGSIAPSGFYLIERTDDTTVPSVTADLIASFGHGISNSGETLILKNNSGSDVDTLAFSSGWPAGDNTTKKTMQRLNSSWITSTATPKSATPGSNNNENTTSGDTDNTPVDQQNTPSGGSGSTPKKGIIPPSVTAEILTQNLATVGVDLSINSSLKYGSETYLVGKLIWNFGDGSTFEQTKVEKFTHRYMHAGDYVLTLKFMKYGYQDTPDATDRMIISVVAPGVVISSIGDESDPYVELENNSKNEVDLSLWKIKSEEAIFTIPTGTIILPSKKLIFSSDVTGFLSNTNVSLLRPSGQVASASPRVSLQTASRYIQNKTSSVSLDEDKATVDLSTGDLSAQAGSSGVSVPVGIIGALILALLGIGGAYLFSQKKSTEGDLLLNSEDIKIIE